MNKRLISIVMLMVLVSVSSCNGMDAEKVSIKLWSNDPKVGVAIGESTISGEAFKGAKFVAPYTDTIDILFPGEREPYRFNREELGIKGNLTIRITKSLPKTYSILFVDDATGKQAKFEKLSRK